MFTGQRPWMDLNDIQIITAVCVLKKMHTRPAQQSDAVAAGFTEEHWRICLRSWAFKPDERPTAREISHDLRALSGDSHHPDRSFGDIEVLQRQKLSQREHQPPARGHGERLTTSRIAHLDINTQSNTQHQHQQHQRGELGSRPPFEYLPPSPDHEQPPAVHPQIGQLLFQQLSPLVQSALSRVNRPQFEQMHSQWIANKGGISSDRRNLKGRLVDMFQLHVAHKEALGIGRVRTHQSSLHYTH